MLKALSRHILTSAELMPWHLEGGSDSWLLLCLKLDEQLSEAEAS